MSSILTATITPNKPSSVGRLSKGTRSARKRYGKRSDSEQYVTRSSGKELTPEQCYAANASNRKKREDKLGAQLRRVLTKQEPLPWSLPFAPEYVSDCRQGQQGTEAFMNVLYCTLRYFVGDTKLPFRVWLEIIKEWNASLHEPFLLDEHCKPADSFWRIVTKVTLRVAADAAVEEQLWLQGISPPESKPRSSQVRMMQAVYCNEGLCYLRTLNHRYIRHAVNEKRNQLLGSGQDKTRKVKQVESEIAKNFNDLGNYTDYFIKTAYFSDQYVKSNTGFRHWNIERRLTNMRDMAMIIPQSSEKQLPPLSSDSLETSYISAPNTISVGFNIVHPLPTATQPFIPLHSEKQLPPNPLLGQVQRVELPQNTGINAKDLLERASNTFSALSLLVQSTKTFCTDNKLVDRVKESGTPRFELSNESAQAWGDLKANQWEKLDTVPLLAIQDCLTSFTNYGGYWHHELCEIQPPKSVQYAGVDFRSIRDNEPDKALSKALRNKFRAYGNEQFSDVATAVSVVEIWHRAKSDKLKTHIEAYREALDKPYPYQVEFNRLHSEYRNAKEIRTEIKNEIAGRSEICVQKKIRTPDHYQNDSDYLRLTAEIAVLQPELKRLSGCIKKAGSLLKILARYREDDLKHSLPACTANGVVKVHDGESRDYTQRGNKEARRTYKNVRWATNDAMKLSGMVSVDLDNIPSDEVETVRKQLIATGLFSLVMKTASGNGLWALARYDRDVFGWDYDGWEKAWKCLWRWIYDLGLESYLDTSAKDQRRYRFLSYDPDCWLDDENRCQLRPLQCQSEDEFSFLSPFADNAAVKTWLGKWTPEGA